MTTDADRLAADGIALRLGERDVRVRFTFRSMRLLEERHGSLAAVNEELQSIINREHPVPFSALGPMLAAGLLHEDGAEDALLDVSPARWGELRDVLVEAINEGFPDAGKAEEGDQGEPPGATSTSSPPSPTAEPTPSSGP